MKRELLEYLIRECVKEVLETFPSTVEPETVGAPAPPAAGQGTADQPAIPPEQPTSPFFTADTKGVWYVDPKRPTKPQQLKLSAQDPSKLERELYRVAAKSAGPRVKVSSSTLREVPWILSNPSAALFLYVGKQNPDDSDQELYLLPAKTYQQAKDLSVSSDVSADHPTTSISSDPSDEEGIVNNMQTRQAGGKTMAPDIDEGAKFRNMVSKMIKEALKENRRR